MSAQGHVRNEGTSRRSGFTLIEVIASLVILSALVAVAGLGLVEMTRGYVYSQEVAEVVHRVQLVTSRMSAEIGRMDRVYTATGSQISYRRWSGSADVVYTIRYDSAADAIYIDAGSGDAPLMKRVGTFAGGESFLTFLQENGAAWNSADPLEDLYSIEVRIPFDFTSGESTDFVTKINPRNNGAANFAMPEGS